MADNNNESDGKLKDSYIVGRTSQGVELQGQLLKLTRFTVVFEMYNPAAVLRTSEVLECCQIIVTGQPLYSGKAVISNLINTGSAVVVCEATLSENSWTDVNLSAAGGKGNWKLGDDYRNFMTEWKKLYQVLPEFKVVVADMQTYLTDLRLWLGQVELGIRLLPPAEQVEAEGRILQELGEAIVPTFDVMHERLEAVSGAIEKDLRPVHQNFSKRLLHPLVLCSPFARRTFQKPLGYAGDYEMVNMIARDPFEGDSLYAKIVNLWFLSQWPAKAHRNRITYLADRLEKEALRMLSAEQRSLRVLNFACGPAYETQHFLRNSHLSDCVDMTLVDFNGETIEHTKGKLESLKQQFHRRARTHFQKKSVLQVLKDGPKPVAGKHKPELKYDYIYCAGLFDYLSDRTCKQMSDIFYDQLSPNGMLVITVVDDYKPFRNMLEFILDWHLIYRDARKVEAVIPDSVPPDARRLIKDTTGVNIFVEMRKPDNGQ
jgi:extracellular factor (EF) 3-hydroxypalmitic acid methyl ester biosynthesis protein